MSSRPLLTRSHLLLGSALLIALLLPTVWLLQRSTPEEPAVTALPTVRLVSARERERYAGSEACARCHAAQFGLHEPSHHAHTLSPVTPESHGARFRQPSKITDSVRGLSYETSVRGNRCVLHARYRDRETRVHPDFGVGSGKHAITYLASQDDQFLELRLSYYADAGRWHFSPAQLPERMGGGVLFPGGLLKVPAEVEECFVCHGTAVVKEGSQLDTGRSLLGVGCEGCHGPGQDHIAAVDRQDRDLHMVRLGEHRERLTRELCGQCHRSPAGEDIHDPFNRSQMPRLQGLALSQSACFLRSAGKLSCLTCHPAHGDAVETRAGYNQKCLSCHSPARSPQKACSLDPAGDCVSCHMPAQSVGMPTGLRYRNHWIKVWNPEQESRSLR